MGSMRLGKITENALDRSIFKQINRENKTKSAAVGSDCAFFENTNAGEEGYILHSCAPVTLDIENPGFYAAHHALNNIYASGGVPVELSSSILLPEDVQESTLRSIVKDIHETAIACSTEEHQIFVGGGHTEVSRAVIRPIVDVNAVGRARNHKLVSCKGAKAGDSLIVTKWVGLEGSAILAKERRDVLGQRYPLPFIDRAAEFDRYMSIKSEAAVAMKSGASAMHDVSCGGIFAALWEMASSARTGLEVDLKSIPVKQETVEICEYFEINLYQMMSGGALLIASSEPESLVTDLLEAGIHAKIIGRLTDGHDRIIRNNDESRFLEMPQADEILKVL